MQHEPDTLFGYPVNDHDYGPSPPPEISTIGAPILSSDEYDNNRQFLDFFTANGPEDFKLLDDLQGVTHDTLPNFHGVSSAFGHPDLITYEHSMQPSSPFTQNLHRIPAVGNINLYSPEINETALFSDPQGISANYAPTQKLQDFNRTHYHLSNRKINPPAPPPNKNERLFVRDSALGFGSDASFANHHYAPPPGTENIEAIEGRMLETLNSLEPSHSVTGNTQPSSPIIARKKRALTEASAVRSSGNSTPGSDGQLLANRKAETRLSTLKDQETYYNRKKARIAEAKQSPSEQSILQRRKSRASETRRQNLTEKEKKENHIKSEQKRRNQIKEGFASLLALMPDGVVEGSTNSKCIVLAKAVDWLTELQEGNERLRIQLRLLEPSESSI